MRMPLSRDNHTGPHLAVSLLDWQLIGLAVILP